MEGFKGWLEPYVFERETSTNMQICSEIVNSGGEQDKDDNLSVLSNTSNASCANSNTEVSSDTMNASQGMRVSTVTGRQSFRIEKKRKTDSKTLEDDLMLTIKDRLSSKKDEDQLFGELLATKLRKLSKLSKLKAKHEIDGIMFRYQLQDEESLQPNDTLRSLLLLHQMINAKKKNRTANE